MTRVWHSRIREQVKGTGIEGETSKRRNAETSKWRGKRDEGVGGRGSGVAGLIRLAAGISDRTLVIGKASVRGREPEVGRTSHKDNVAAGCLMAWQEAVTPPDGAPTSRSTRPDA